jgi:hypothetical protein
LGCVPPKEASNQLHCVFKEAHATVLRTFWRLAGHCLFEKAASVGGLVTHPVRS